MVDTEWPAAGFVDTILSQSALFSNAAELKWPNVECRGHFRSGVIHVGSGLSAFGGIADMNS